MLKITELASDEGPIEFTFSEQLRATFDPSLGAMFLRWSPKPRPCFNLPLLRACNEYCQFLQSTNGVIENKRREYTIRSSVLTSEVPGVFNLGGDLNLFTALMDKHDRPGLLEYGMACVEVVYRNLTCYELPLTTVSLVQGECLGGGFEAALSSQVVIAERRARFGFPEIMFNLFPGMGALSFVLRRADRKVAEELTASATVFSAEDMLKRGLIDIVVNDGEGPAAVDEFLRKREPALRALYQVRRRVQNLRRSELDDIVNLWVDAAMRLNPRDVRLMGHLVARQDRLTLP